MALAVYVRSLNLNELVIDSMGFVLQMEIQTGRQDVLKLCLHANDSQ